MILRHLRLPGLTPYATASALQDRLVASFLAHKRSPATVPAPPPTVLTAQFQPVYTCGRREIGTVSAAQQARLRLGLLHHGGAPAAFHEALRGGRTTFHGPGQLVAYAVVDLRAHGLTARGHVCLLERAAARACARFGVVAAGSAEGHPGVWVGDDAKIAALGVHLRRSVSSHGVGLNVCTDLAWFERIVACGLEGKRTTSLAEQGVQGVGVEEVARVFVEEFADGLGGVQAVQEISEADLE